MPLSIAQPEMTKVDDNSIQLVTTNTQVVPISRLTMQQVSLQTQIDRLQAMLDDVNSQIQQAADLGVGAAQKVSGNRGETNGTAGTATAEDASAVK